MHSIYLRNTTRHKSAKFFFPSLLLIQELQIQKENVFFTWWLFTEKTTPYNRWVFFKNSGKFVQWASFTLSSPDYPINEQDLDGNTPLLIAYMNGQAALCVALAKAGSVLAKPNSEGITIFNLEVATKRFRKFSMTIFYRFQIAASSSGSSREGTAMGRDWPLPDHRGEILNAA